MEVIKDSRVPQVLQWCPLSLPIYNFVFWCSVLVKPKREWGSKVDTRQIWKKLRECKSKISECILTLREWALRSICCTSPSWFRYWLFSSPSLYLPPSLSRFFWRRFPHERCATLLPEQKLLYSRFSCSFWGQKVSLRLSCVGSVETHSTAREWEGYMYTYMYTRFACNFRIDICMGIVSTWPTVALLFLGAPSHRCYRTPGTTQRAACHENIMRRTSSVQYPSKLGRTVSLLSSRDSKHGTIHSSSALKSLPPPIRQRCLVTKTCPRFVKLLWLPYFPSVLHHVENLQLAHIRRLMHECSDYLIRCIIASSTMMMEYSIFHVDANEDMFI